MIFRNKYYFLATDLFVSIRVFIYSTLILVSIFAFIQINILFAFGITSSLLLTLFIIDSGYVSVDNYNKNIIIKNIYGITRLSSIAPYLYWWNYDFDPGTITTDHNTMEQKWESRSNKVIVNLVLQNDIHRIRFIETIMLDTRHPNDAIYIEEYNSESTRVVRIQRIDKLMTFLEANLDEGRFVIDDKYIKKVDLQ